MKKLAMFLTVLLAATATVAAARSGASQIARVRGPVVLTGTEDVVSSGVIADEHPFPTPLDDWTPGSIVDTAGWTYYDVQANGTQGKQIGVDADGFAHLVWTIGLPIPQRHVYYNVWDPTTQDFIFGGGVQVDASSRAGFCNIAVDPAGWAYPFFHQVMAVDPHTAVAMDFLPRQGAFMVFGVPGQEDQQIIWPHAAMDGNGDLHGVAANFDNNYDIYHFKGHPIPQENLEWPIGFTLVDSQSFISADVAASRHTQKVAVAWLDNTGDNPMVTDVFLKISEDGGQTWGAPINVTNFVPWDPYFCTGDSLQPWLDLSVLIDNDDNVHIAFSTPVWDCDPMLPTRLIYAMMWHWDSQHLEYNRIGEAWYIPADPNFVGAGINNIMCQRPSLAEDTTSGNLYCSFQKFDSLIISPDPCFRPVADAYVSVSTDGGRYWAVPTNVTNTAPVPGNDRSERDITIATVVNGYVHMEYLVDHSAGSFAGGVECLETHNEIVYQKIPVEDIATTPLTPAFPLRGDSTGFPPLNDSLYAGQAPRSVPGEFTLSQNYPNPFNPSTTIAFDVPKTGHISLRVFDLLGREVMVLKDGFVKAGTHRVTFDGRNLASGIYFARLEAGEFSQTRKLMLMK